MVWLRMLLVTTSEDEKVELAEMLEAFSGVEDNEGIMEVEIFPSLTTGSPDFLIAILLEVEKKTLAEMARVLRPIVVIEAECDFIREVRGYTFDASHYASDA